MPNLSIIPAAAVMDRDLTPTQLRVLCAVGIHTDKMGGNVWASVKTLATEAGVAERTFQSACQELMARGYLRITKRPGRTNLYQVVLEPPADPPQVAAPPLPDAPPPQQQLVHPTPAIAAAPKRPQLATPMNDLREMVDALIDAYPERPEPIVYVAAMKAVDKTLSSGATIAQLVRAAQRYATHCDLNHTEPRYVKSLVRFLEDEVWKVYDVAMVHGRTRADWVASGQDGTKWDRLLAGEPYEEVMAG